ncbi:MAG TPA: tetratricopeptide repeat protein [Thermoplasmata archaeon]|nr:tetratricopeptide repeat protein [Thermoplasmata archaeon]
MPGKTARALCPVCQEPMPPDETECENCGAFVIDEAVVRLCRAFGIPREKALALFEKGFRHPTQLKDRNVDDVLERGENGLLFLCTNCGGFVATGDPKCPRCGAEFEAEEAEPAAEKDILDIVLCPICGADNDPSWKECEICGEPLGGTEEPPGEAPATPASAPESRPIARPPEAVPEPHALDRIDDILEELEKPVAAKTGPAVRRRQRIPKVAKPLRTPERPPPVPTPRSESPNSPNRAPVAPPMTSAPVRPTPRRTIHPLPKPLAPSKPAAAPQPGPTRDPKKDARPPARPPPAVRRTRRKVWSAPPAEFTGGITVAAAASLLLSQILSEVAIAWAVVLALLILALFVLVATLSQREIRVGGLDAMLLAAGAGLGVIAPLVPSGVASVVAVGGAVPLALATRRILTTRARDLLAVAAGIPLMAFGVAAASGSAFASTSAWILGVVAVMPWPAVVAMVGFRQRHSSVALHRELTKAEHHLEREDYAASVKDFDRAIAAGAQGTPGAEVPWYGKGASLILLGRYDEALRAIDTALDMNPRNEVAWLNKGNALSKMGRLIDALRCFNAALKVNPRYEVAWNNKGNTMARMGHFEEALACYERALAIDPEYRGAWVNKGYVLTKLGRYDEATSCADRALRLNEGPRSKTA